LQSPDLCEELQCAAKLDLECQQQSSAVQPFDTINSSLLWLQFLLLMQPGFQNTLHQS